MNPWNVFQCAKLVFEIVLLMKRAEVVRGAMMFDMRICVKGKSRQLNEYPMFLVSYHEQYPRSSPADATAYRHTTAIGAVGGSRQRYDEYPTSMTLGYRGMAKCCSLLQKLPSP